MSRGFGAAASLVLLAGCASSQVTLLDNEGDNPTGSVAVIDEKRGTERVVDTPLTAAKLSGRSAPRPVKQLKPAYGQLLGSLPPPARRFVIKFPAFATAIPPEYRPVIDQIRAEFASRRGAEIEVVGHTDTVGSEEANDKVSQDRADAVVKALVAEGFVMDALSAVGRGERELAIQTGDEVPSEDNRRVVVVVR